MKILAFAYCYLLLVRITSSKLLKFMEEMTEKWDRMIHILESIDSGIGSLREVLQGATPYTPTEFVHVPFKGPEIYLLQKAFIDSGGAPNDNYKSLLEKTVGKISNKTQKGFSAQSFSKYSDKVSPETKENVKRFLQRMIRNIDSYD